MAISATNVNLFLDHISRVYARLLGVSGASSYGMGDVGDTDRAVGSAVDLVAAVLATGDVDVVNGILQKATRYEDSLSAVAKATPSGLLIGVENLIRELAISGVSTLDQFLTYYNYGAGGTNAALQSPYFRAIHYRWKLTYPTARNLYFEILQGGSFDGTTFTNALRKLVVGTGETPGDSISTDYAGGVPYVNCTVFNGASDTVTVTGTEYNPATGTRTANKTWTATVAGVGRVALASGGATPASANALIVASSAVAAGANITAGSTIFVEASKPSGRLAVPF